MSQRILVGAFLAASIAALSASDAAACIRRDRLASIEQARKEKQTHKRIDETQDVSAAKKVLEDARQSIATDVGKVNQQAHDEATRMEEARRKAEAACR
jgi:biopolymer transport protein ExbB/TolQ